jgi:hypothetical protein
MDKHISEEALVTFKVMHYVRKLVQNLPVLIQTWTLRAADQKQLEGA